MAGRAVGYCVLFCDALFHAENAVLKGFMSETHVEYYCQDCGFVTHDGYQAEEHNRVTDHCMDERTRTDAACECDLKDFD